MARCVYCGVFTKRLNKRRRQKRHLHSSIYAHWYIVSNEVETQRLKSRREEDINVFLSPELDCFFCLVATSYVAKVQR